MKKNRLNNTAYFLVLLLTDLAAYYAALFTAYEFRLLAAVIFNVIDLQFSLEYLASLWWITVLVIFFHALNGLYRRRDPLWLEAGKTFRSLTLAFIIVLAIVSLGQMSDEISRLFLILLWIISVAFTIIFRIFVKRIIFKFSYFQEKALLVGSPARMDYVGRSFDEDRNMGIKIVAIVPLDNEVTNNCVNTLINDSDITAAIIVPPQYITPRIGKVIKHIHTRLNRLIYVPYPGATDMTNSESGQLLSSQVGYLLVKNALGSTMSRFLKRMFDIILAIILLPFILPVIGGLAIAIRMTSPGPGIFSHERVGKGGKIFRVYKLRTMYKNSAEILKNLIESDPAIREEWEATYKLKNDPRITPLGKFLRKTSLDELPQFFNVLKGEMSFVGPRPVLKEELEKYYRDDAVYYGMATPGITGLWQVSGRNDTSYETRVSMDCWYVFNWSLWLDIVILFSTPLVVILRRGAY